MEVRKTNDELTKNCHAYSQSTKQYSFHCKHFVNYLKRKSKTMLVIHCVSHSVVVNNVMLAESGFGSAVVVVCKYVCSLLVSMYNIFCCTEYTSGG